MTLTPAPLRVLVLGGSYAGLGAALNLLDLCNGKPSRFSGVVAEERNPVIPVHIKVVDERDGYCKCLLSVLLHALEGQGAYHWLGD